MDGVNWFLNGLCLVGQGVMHIAFVSRLSGNCGTLRRTFPPSASSSLSRTGLVWAGFSLLAQTCLRSML